MIDINWLKQNFPEDLTIFDIGCAGMNSEIKCFRNDLPYSKIYAFECADYWLQENIENSIKYGVYYFHIAVHSSNSLKHFIPSQSENGQAHPYSGSFYKDILPYSKKIYGEPYEVTTTRLDVFCKNFNTIPDFIHMDVEGSEFDVISSMGDIRPKAIWTELIGFKSYDVKTNFQDFDFLMQNLGYNLVFEDDHDGLYCLNSFKHSVYNQRIGHK